MKSANWISATGRRPFRALPIATPTMQDSARGVSSTLASPYLAWRPSVARNTPPLRPTSSPSTQTRGSRSISSWRASRMPSIRVLTATVSSPHGVDVTFEVGRVRGRRRLGRLHRRLHLGQALPPESLLVLLGEERLLPQVGAEAIDGVGAQHLLQLLRGPVAPLIVVRGVGGEAPAASPDQGGTLAGACPPHRLAHGLVDGQGIAAVDVDAGHAVAPGSLRHRYHRHLQPARDRDGVAVVLHQADEGQTVDAGEVQGLVPVPAGGAALAQGGE